MTDGSDPNNPKQQPLAPNLRSPVQNPAPGPDDLGFAASPKKEKYNTQFLTANMDRDRRRTQMIILAILFSGIAGVVLWVALAPSSPPVPATPQETSEMDNPPPAEAN